tara:strand:- start:3977 stop:4171 length:195 start_codon:yes stop_codon:yes gene_type:complete
MDGESIEELVADYYAVDEFIVDEPIFKELMVSIKPAYLKGSILSFETYRIPVEQCGLGSFEAFG